MSIESIETFEDYVEWTNTTAVYMRTVESALQECYEVESLTGEAGEVANLHKKYLAKKRTYPEYKQEVILELGDICYYIARLLLRYDITLDDVVQANIVKLTERYKNDQFK